MGGDRRFLARESHSQPIGGHLYGWFCDAMFQTGVVNTPDATTDLFHQLHPVEHTEEQGVSGNALAAQVFLTHTGRQCPRRDDLHPVLMSGRDTQSAQPHLEDGSAYRPLRLLHELLSTIRNRRG